MAAEQFTVRVAEVESLTPKVKRLRLTPVDGRPLPPASAGAHTVLTLQTGERVLRNAYSLLASSHSGEAYDVAVLRTEDSRGGSRYIHEKVREGHELALSAPVNLFPVNRLARHHVLVAGGIGITPIMAMAEELARTNQSFELHYAMRDDANGAFWTTLRERYGDRVHLYFSERDERLKVAEILPNQPLGSHLYVCGPERMIEGVLADARAEGWPDANLHAERFVSAGGGDPFAVTLAKSEKSLTVGEEESLLEAIERVGIDAPFLCRGGACGECMCDVIEADGELDHRDHILTEDERRSAEKILICVSRLKGRELVLDL
ncbi:PDR/VanB family oxidoreductase [Fulvimarina sp. MAC8]|uniref:PDR/VanB family oxidoreductase n=1 Tax=Fulvimarina sp. MAC8 TaxID=3162874 RepID=UPI0032EADC65